MRPTLSIAVNSYRNPELLRLCLESVFRCAGEADFEVLVVDSATEEATRLVMEDFPQARFFSYEHNVGFRVLLNRSLEEANGEFLFLINHDIILTEETVPSLLRFMRSDPGIGVIGPRQINFNGSEQISCFRFYRPWTILYRRTVLGKLPFGRKHLDWFLMKDYDRKEPLAVDWIMGSAMFVRRSAFEEIGPMDTRFFMYMEDVDWCRRFWEAGWKVVHVPSIPVYHYHGKGSASGGLLKSLLLNRLTWYHISSAVKYFLKYAGKPLPKHDMTTEGQTGEQEPTASEPGADPTAIERKNRRLVRRVLGVFFFSAALFGAYQFGLMQGKSGSGRENGPNVLSPGNAVFSNVESQDRTIDFSLFWKVWNILKEKYVDRGNLDAKKLFYGSIKGMLAATGDPYTTFFDPEEQKSFNEDMSGKFEGIGAEMGIRDEVLTVIAPLDGAPAEKAGLRPDDKVVKIDDEKTANLALEEAVGKIRGPKGSEVKLTILHAGETETRDVTVVRDVIDVKSVKLDFRDDGIAILRVSKFGDETDSEFHSAVSGMIGKKPKGVILDLRSNPGGLLDAAVSMASLMIPSGQTVVWEEDGKGDRKPEKTFGGDVLSDIPTVVLIDEGSASASEILAGALRENRKNVMLVGKKSFGKGSVQELVPVGKDVSVKVTIARWLTPDGNQINEKGISPDTEAGITIDDIKAGRDPQKDKAIEVLKKMIGSK